MDLIQLPGALILMIISQCFCNTVVAQEIRNQNGTAGTNRMAPAVLGLGDTIQTAGGMARTNQNFQDGESVLVGKQQVHTNNTFLQIGQGPTRTVNITGGPGLQEVEFIGGLKFSVQSDEPLRFNVDTDEGINPGTLPSGTLPLSSYSWVINSTNSKARVNAQLLVPFNREMLVALKPFGSSPSTMLAVYKRSLSAKSGQFLPINAEMQVVRELPEDRISIPMVTQLDGRYTILVTQPKTVGKTGAQELSPVQAPSAPQMAAREVGTRESALYPRGARGMREPSGMGSR